jgi:outer membrane protein assembly factor BamA
MVGTSPRRCRNPGCGVNWSRPTDLKSASRFQKNAVASNGWYRVVPPLLVATLCATPAVGQDPSPDAPSTRADTIAAARDEKEAELWPERQNAMVNLVDGLVERGLKEGLDSGKGANGLQLVFGGMRSGQGLSMGVGYRRSDLFRDRLGYRGTARGTVWGAYMLDFEVDFSGLRTKRTSLQWYTKYEHSPEIDYFGAGNDTSNDIRSSFRYDDFSTDLNATYEPARNLHFGATGGYFHAHTAPSGEDGVPPIDQLFRPAALYGFGEDTGLPRIGLFGYFDSRDSQTGPRSGGLYGFRYREYWSAERQQFGFRQTEFELQQYFPYFNKGRVLAVRAAIVLSFPDKGNAVPFYLQPTLGGSDELRGFVPFRFRDYHSLTVSVEHRWYAFSFLDMALFADAGKVVRLKRNLDPAGMHYSGGAGFRVRLRSAIISRIDFAASDEGLRMIWTFSDAFSPPH